MRNSSSDSAARIKEICNDLHISARQLAFTAGIEPHNFYDIFSGKCGISKYVAMMINKALPDYSVNWLLTGEEPSIPKDAGNDARGTSIGAVNVVRSPRAKTKIETGNADSKDRYIEWLQEQLEKAQEENRRLLDIILELKK